MLPNESQGNESQTTQAMCPYVLFLGRLPFEIKRYGDDWKKLGKEPALSRIYTLWADCSSACSSFVCPSLVATEAELKQLVSPQTLVPSQPDKIQAEEVEAHVDSEFDSLSEWDVEVPDSPSSKEQRDLLIMNMRYSIEAGLYPGVKTVKEGLDALSQAHFGMGIDKAGRSSERISRLIDLTKEPMIHYAHFNPDWPAKNKIKWLKKEVDDTWAG